MASKANVFMPSMTFFFFFFYFFFFLSIPMQGIHSSTSKPWVRAGFYLARSELRVAQIDSSLFTHIICGSAFINSTTYELYINSTTAQIFPTFTNLVKLKNPSLTTLFAVWLVGDQAPIFASTLSRRSRRRSFVESSIATARAHGFEGIDLYGASPSENLDALFDELREAMDSESKSSNRTKLILATTANHEPGSGSLSFPLESMKRSVDWVHLRSHGYYVPTSTNLTHPHAALHDKDPNKTNTNNGVQEWIRRGFPVDKLVLGLPFYGYAWALVDPGLDGIGSPASGPTMTSDGSMGFAMMKAFIRSDGFGRVSVTYDSSYVVNYCTVAQRWLNFDDVEAVRAKVSYAKKMGLLGYYAFHLGSDENWVLSRAAHGEDGHQRNKNTLLIISLSTTALLVLLFGFIICFIKWRAFKTTGFVKILKWSTCRLKINKTAPEEFNTNGSTVQVFSYRTIKLATDNFSFQNKIGEGGFGPVYKGSLRKGHEIAVKRLSKTSNQGVEEFKNEVMLAANLQHVNLLRVLGYSTEREEKLLIYENMPNKSLDTYLFDPARQHLLDWERRVHIIEGIIQGLIYLQEYSNYRIIHRDLKTSNILLDDKMNPKISDFGLARIFNKEECEAKTKRIVGTYGYVPPEYVKKGTYSTKYDVYSFGVLLLQIISGKRNSCLYGSNENLNLLNYAYELSKEGKGTQFIDSALDDSSSSCKLLKCLHVGLLCVEENPVDRPSMLEISLMLRNETSEMNIPKKPAFSCREDQDIECVSQARREIGSVDCVPISELIPR